MLVLGYDSDSVPIGILLLSHVLLLSVSVSFVSAKCSRTWCTVWRQAPSASGGLPCTSTARSLLRVCKLTTSLVSICLGTLLPVVLSTLQFLFPPHATNEVVVPTTVAIYVKDFRGAAIDTLQLFRALGWLSLLHDSFISAVQSVGCLVVGTSSKPFALAFRVQLVGRGRLAGCAHPPKSLAYCIHLTLSLLDRVWAADVITMESRFFSTFP